MLRALEIEDDEIVVTKYTSRLTPLASYNRTSKEFTFYPLVAEDPWRAVSIADYIFLSAFLYCLLQRWRPDACFIIEKDRFFTEFRIDRGDNAAENDLAERYKLPKLFHMLSQFVWRWAVQSGME